MIYVKNSCKCDNFPPEKDDDRTQKNGDFFSVFTLFCEFVMVL